MNDLKLNAKELMCLAAWFDTTEVFGIPDAFSNAAPETMRGEVLEAQQSLQEKGVLTLDFDGNTDVQSEWNELLEIVFHCEGFTALDRQLVDGGHTGFLFYRRNGNIVASRFDGQDYTFERIGADEYAQRIDACVGWEILADGPSETNAQIPQRGLLKLKNKDNRSICAELIRRGLSKEAAVIVADAFALRSNFYSFAFVDVNAKTDGIKSLMFLGDGRGILEVRNTLVGNADYVALSGVKLETLRKKLAQDAQWFLSAHAEVKD